ncbi:MAG TPA: type II secretion system protein GspK [Gammaproteobacteria bacterium]|nr:general secretion pathway protein GspK [Xanthomonadales bacterium]MCB1594888.1 general secretion pathway protein GspK [Xanthomonadales bacterium]HPI95723.1 type II secretion system protein GspK [Gammaproteobacteria bacterium]HPQ87600.1 type II secretion system protein GspK [Gammaproteobacteria bacterium]
MGRIASVRKQKGIALILVLWVTVLLTVIASSFALSARTEATQARMIFDTTKARYLAEAGMHRAVYELRNPDPEARWIADGRKYEMELEETKIEIYITDETGKIDINLASAELLVGLFASLGMSEDEAMSYAEKVIDWRDNDDIKGLDGAEDDDYEAEGYPYGAKDALFDTVPELQQVMGINYDMYRQLEPAITVYSGNRDINIAYAPEQALMAMPGIEREDARAFIEERSQMEGLDRELPMLGDEQSGATRGGGVAFSIKTKATLSNGHWAEMDATIRLGGTVNGRPFRVLRWRDNEHL